MATAKLTLIGLYNYDDSIFSDMTLPEGIDRETLVNTILQSGEFEVQYPDWHFTKDLAEHIAKKWYRTFDKWYKALQLEYNPIYNYDRFEEWTDNGTDSGTVKNDGSTSETSGANGTTETQVSAYDSNTYQPDGKSISSQNANANGQTANTETRDLATSGKHSGHLYGNIGVTTSQQMLESELELAKWNLYQHMADIFIEELCIMVYD